MFILNWNNIIQTNLFFIYFISFIIFINSQDNNCIFKEVETGGILKKKCETISNGNNVCVQESGIFTYNSVLSNVLFEYSFSSIANIIDRRELGLISITEFKEVDSKRDHIVLCFIKSQFLFILSYEGEFIFYYSFNEIIPNYKYFSITLYKFDKSKKEYYYTISYTNNGLLLIIYNQISIEFRSNKILNQIEYRPYFMKENYDPWVVSNSGSSCEFFSEGIGDNVITCFFISQSDNKYFSSASFLPDENFTVNSNYSYILDNNIYDITNIKFIRTARYDEIKSLICLANIVRTKCIIYNSIDHQITETNSELTGCKDEIYANNIYFYTKTKEFIYSCIGNQNYLKMIKFAYDLNNINSTAITYYFESSCSSPYGYSIIYISPFKIYSIVIDLDCSFAQMLKDYLLIENTTECDNIKNNIKEGEYSEDENEEDNDDKESTQKMKSTEIAGVSEKMQQNYDTIHITYQPYINEDGKTNKITESIQIKETIQNTLNNQIIETVSEDLQSSIHSELTQSIINSKITESPKNSYSPSSIDFSQESFKETEFIKDTIEQKIETIKINDYSNIIDSSKIIESSEITDSKIIESNKIIDSSRLIESNIISDSSRLIRSSETIDSSKFIESSEIFDTSDKIKSNEITYFSKITESSNTMDSSIITDSSKTIEFSQIINASENIISSQINISDSLQIIESSKIPESIKTIDSSTYSESSLISDINQSSKIIESSHKIKSYELTEYLSKTTQNEKIICDKKCLECDEESNARNLCIKCNNNNNYFELKLNNQIIEDNQNYIECYSEETKISNYYLNKKDKVFEPCFYTCGTCKELGDQNDHKCLTCANNYRKNPYNNNSCVMECKYFFYFSNFGEYKCTTDNQCPEEANILIKSLSKCTNDCKNEGEYKFQYNGECLKNCPSDTEVNDENNMCQIINKDKCSFSHFELFLDNDIQKNNIEKLAKDYVKEYYYTNNHISNYISNQFSIIIYKNSECIQKLKLSLPKIDFGECYKKVQDYYTIKEDLIIGVIDSYDNKNNSSSNNPETTYAFFHPVTGINLNASEICKDIKIKMEENILSIVDDNKNILFFASQNVNIFNISNEFYTDRCFYFESWNNKDVVLRDRINYVYPNITLCDRECKNIGINLTSLTAICECSFRDLLDISNIENDWLSNNILVDEVINQIHEIITLLNLEVMRCYKTIFDPKYISKCTGGFLILFILICAIICTVVYFNYSIKETLGFLFRVSRLYLKFIEVKKLKNVNNNKGEIKAPPKKKKEKLKTDIFPSKKKKIVKINSEKLKGKRTTKNVNININMAEFNFNSSRKKNNKLGKIFLNQIRKQKKKSQILKDANNLKTSSISKTYRDKSKFQFLDKTNSSLFEIKNGFNIEEYIANTYEEMDYEDAIFEEKRSFWKYFIERIKNKHILINSFFIVDHIQPKSIKIILFLMQIDLYFLVNAMLFNEDYISEIFHNDEEETFFSFVPRSINRYIYTTFVGTILNYLIKCFFIKEKKFIRILIRSEKDSVVLNNELYIFTEKLKKSYLIFVICCMTTIIFSWYYISCFNNIYQYTKREWIISSFAFIFVTQIIYVCAAFLETIFRYLSFKFESDKIYKFSLLFSLVE